MSDLVGSPEDRFSRVAAHNIKRVACCRAKIMNVYRIVEGKRFIIGVSYYQTNLSLEQQPLSITLYSFIISVSFMSIYIFHKTPNDYFSGSKYRSDRTSKTAF